MKKLFIYLILIAPASCIAQYDTIFHNNRINILTVSIDYQDYAFSGAAMNYYDCPTCSNDSLPYQIDYQQPMDFGSMTFQLNPSNDTIFHGGIIWMGTGHMTHPLLSSNENPPFDNLGSSLPLPSEISYLGAEGNNADPNTQTDMAWEAVSQIRLVQMMMDEEFDVVCYLYAPTVGMFDPAPAKWMFFFYKKKYSGSGVGIDENNLQNVSIYPNPATEKLNFSSLVDLKSYVIRDLTGKMVQFGTPNSSKEINIEHLPGGVYLIEFTNDHGQVQKLKWTKQ